MFHLVPRERKRTGQRESKVGQSPIPVTSGFTLIKIQRFVWSKSELSLHGDPPSFTMRRSIRHPWHTVNERSVIGATTVSLAGRLSCDKAWSRNRITAIHFSVHRKVFCPKIIRVVEKIVESNVAEFASFEEFKTFYANKTCIFYRRNIYTKITRIYLFYIYDKSVGIVRRVK